VMQPWLKEKHIQLIYDHQPLKLHINGWKIKQALQNLLSNAIAFSPPERQITCEWQVFQTEVLIKIRDEGPGLSAEDLRSWGTPFYSRRPGGTGLGLAIAKEIIAEHKGSLWAENLPQCGAQFCIVLPRMP
jgi:signal transduction histidine kinase